MLGLTTLCESWRGQKPKGKAVTQPRAALRAAPERGAEALTCMAVGVLPAVGSVLMPDVFSPGQRLTGQHRYLGLLDPITAPYAEMMAFSSPACGEER